MAKFFGSKYIPPFQEDLSKIPWYERDLMKYIDRLKYEEMFENPDAYFKNKEVVNFDIISNKHRGDPLEKSIKDHKTVAVGDFKDFPTEEKKKVVSSVFRNKRGDLWVQRDLIIKHFKEIL